MLRYLSKRLLVLVPTFLGITLITFVVIRLAPGDPAAMKIKMTQQGQISDQAMDLVVEQTRALYGLDKPIWVQYLSWTRRILTFDFGTSYLDHRPVLEKIKEALPITLLLNVITIFIIYLVAIPWGVASALSPNSLWDRFSALVLFVLYSLPSFWVAMLLILYLGGGEYLNWFPVAGLISDSADQLSWMGRVGNVMWHLVLPVICLTYGGFTFLARFSRATMLEVVRQDYVRTARAKGLSSFRVVFHHAFRNALIPQLTLLGTLLPELLAGSVIIERIFAIPGMGRLGFEAVLSRDYPVVMAIATISALLTLVSLLLSDLLYAVADPRIGFETKETVQ